MFIRLVKSLSTKFSKAGYRQTGLGGEATVFSPPGNFVVIFIFLVAVSLMVIAPAPGRADNHSTVRAVEFSHTPVARGFVLPSLDGTDVSLADFRGRLLLLNFWASWCPPCVRELPAFNVLQQQFPPEQLTVVAISSDENGIDDIRPFTQSMKLTYPILMDKDGATSSVYGATHLPLTFLVNEEGKILAAFQGERDWGADQMVKWISDHLPE